MKKKSLANVVESWKSMKLWVKIWLFYLNAIYLTSIFFFGDHSVIILTLMAYIASGPYLMSLAIPSSGLSRVLGLAHIVPWTPLCIYIVLLISTPETIKADLTDATTSEWLLGYLVILLTSTIACLVFDYHDIYRWWKGERYILGTKEAFEFGASQLGKVDI